MEASRNARIRITILIVHLNTTLFIIQGNYIYVDRGGTVVKVRDTIQKVAG